MTFTSYVLTLCTLASNEIITLTHLVVYNIHQSLQAPLRITDSENSVKKGLGCIGASSLTSESLDKFLAAL